MSAYYSQQNKTETPNCFVDPMKGIDPCRLSASDMFIVAARGRMLTRGRMLVLAQRVQEGWSNLGAPAALLLLVSLV